MPNYPIADPEFEPKEVEADGAIFSRGFGDIVRLSDTETRIRSRLRFFQGKRLLTTEYYFGDGDSVTRLHVHGREEIRGVAANGTRVSYMIEAKGGRETLVNEFGGVLEIGADRYQLRGMLGKSRFLLTDRSGLPLLMAMNPWWDLPEAVRWFIYWGEEPVEEPHRTLFALCPIFAEILTEKLFLGGDGGG